MRSGILTQILFSLIWTCLDTHVSKENKGLKILSLFKD